MIGEVITMRFNHKEYEKRMKAAFVKRMGDARAVDCQKRISHISAQYREFEKPKVLYFADYYREED